MKLTNSVLPPILSSNIHFRYSVQLELENSIPHYIISEKKFKNPSV